MVGKSGLGEEEKKINVLVSDTYSNSNDWDAFVERHPSGHHAQTSFWAIAKETIGWKGIRLAVAEQNNIIAGAQLLLHPIPVIGNIGYVVKGPLYPIEDCHVGKILLTHILKTASKNHCFLIVIQPPNHASDFCGLLQESGFQASRQSPEHASTLILELSQGLDRIKAGMKRQTLQSIRRSEREGIQVREGSHADLNTYHDLHQATSQRQGFAPYPPRYFERLWQVFQPRGHLSLLLAEYKGEPVSSLLLMCFRDTVYAYILGWSGKYSNLRPNHALFWGAIQWAGENKFEYFDFGGVDPSGAHAVLSGEELPEHLQHSPDFLKYGFGGKITLYPQAFDYAFNPVLNGMYRKIPTQIGKHSALARLFSQSRKVLMRN